MKKGFLILFLIINVAQVWATDLEHVRRSFYKASFEQEVCESVFNLIKDKDYSNDPILLGYQGVYRAIMAKYLWNPFSKWMYFQDGIEDLEKAIKLDSFNIELVFLRFSVQTNCPSFLGYNNEIKRDKKFIMKSLKNESICQEYAHFIPDIINYLLKSSHVSKQEKTQLTAINNHISGKTERG